MYCRHCGREVDENYKVCPYCGTSIDPNNNPSPIYQEPTKDSGSFGWGLLSLFFPPVGFVLWIVWRKQKPKTAKVCLVGAITGFIVNIILFIAQIILEINMVVPPSSEPLPPVTDF